MARYVYPAIFEPEDGLYNVWFPDLPDCYTCGDDLAHAMYMAQDVLADVLADHEAHVEAINPPTPIKDIDVPDGCTVTLVFADTDAWRRSKNTRAVKKTLTIPEWLNTAAEIKGINFSQTLQEALRTQLNL